MPRNLLFSIPAVMLATFLAACGGSNSGSSATTATSTPAATSAQNALATSTPIKHVVVIFGENISFDHYFGTYPNATNPTGQPSFTKLANTPSMDNYTANSTLLTANPVFLNSANAAAGVAGQTNPIRLDRSQAWTASMNHNYTPEQQAFDAVTAGNPAMDLFPVYTGKAGTTGTGYYATKGLVMGYYDGNTVTGMWNYAQHFALNDASYDTQFGPSTPGALNLISGQTNGASSPDTTLPIASEVLSGGADGSFTVIGDPDPAGDTCSAAPTVAMSGKNIGDLLNAKNITWGWFEGGFDLTKTNANGTTGCKRSTYSSIVGSYKSDYVPHHEPFQYYASTRNPAHTRPTSTALIGYSADAANHQYDLNDFYSAVSAGNFPSVSFLKAPAIQDAHANNSDPIDEQVFVTTVVNFLQQQADWSSTLVVLAYDDSDGWYDHAYKIVNASKDSTADVANLCSTPSTQLAGVSGSAVNGRCGYGPRLPLLAISPYAKQNYVDHTLTDQTSVLRFIEDNWLAGARLGGGSFDAIAGTINNMFDFTNGGSTPKLFLDNQLGTVVDANTVSTAGTTGSPGS